MHPANPLALDCRSPPRNAAALALVGGAACALCMGLFAIFFTFPFPPPMVDWADNGLPALVTVTRRRSARPCFGSASGLQSERHRYAETGQRLLGCLDALPFVAEGWPRLFAEPQIYSAGRKRATRCGVCIRSCVRLCATGTPEAFDEEFADEFDEFDYD